jgi:UDP-N-acetylmuramyl pentapeptide phosphotransferase/UDP-N-acetylglucosamine-1-phosphate transferase
MFLLFAFISIILNSALCYYGITFFKDLLIKNNFVDIPSTDKVHKNVTPRGGGLVIAIVLLLNFYFSQFIFPAQYWNKILVPFFVAVFVSFIDDMKNLSVSTRLITHFIFCGYLVFELIYPYTILHGEINPFFDSIFMIIALVTFVNIYNFMDGIDGLTGVETIHLCVTFITLFLIKKENIINANLILMIAIPTIGCMIGFLFLNWHPAKIFIGDVGSISLGLLIGFCLLSIAVSGSKFFVSAIISSLYYLVDGGLTMLIRIVRREKFWLPHLNHFFHQAVRSGMSHDTVIKKILVCNMSLYFLSVFSLYYPLVSVILSILTVSATIIHFSYNDNTKITK